MIFSHKCGLIHINPNVPISGNLLSFVRTNPPLPGLLVGINSGGWRSWKKQILLTTSTIMFWTYMFYMHCIYYIYICIFIMNIFIPIFMNNNTTNNYYCIIIVIVIIIVIINYNYSACRKNILKWCNDIHSMPFLMWTYDHRFKHSCRVKSISLSVTLQWGCDILADLMEPLGFGRCGIPS